MNKINLFLKRLCCSFLAFYIIAGIVTFTLPVNKVIAANVVDAVDSFKITHIYDPNLVYIAWVKENPGIAGSGKLTSGEQVRLYLDWSIKESDTVQSGDYFSFTFPNVLNHALIEEKRDIELRNSEGIVMGLYSIVNNNGEKQLIITFTEGAIGHEQIMGSYELVMFMGDFITEETVPCEFKINGMLIGINGGVTTLLPPPPTYTERGDAKWGTLAERNQVIDGHYFFKWAIWLNFGFNTIDNYSVNDIIQSSSPHVFITPQTAGNLGITIPSNFNYLYDISIREYIGADDLPTQDKRYRRFQDQLNNIGGQWYENYMQSYKFNTSSLTSAPSALDGIDYNGGINLSDFTFSSDGKSFSANLGRVTRPVIIEFYTITTQTFSENAFYDDATAAMLGNSVILNGNEERHSRAYGYWIDESASIGGIYGNYSFSLKKLDENNQGLADAMFSLYTNSDCTGPADRTSISQYDGTLTFGSLKSGIYYIKEINAPAGYALSEKIYKVELAGKDNYTLYYMAENADVVIPEKQIQNKIYEDEEEIVPEKPKLQIKKIDSISGDILAGAVFELLYKDNDEEEYKSHNPAVKITTTDGLSDTIELELERIYSLEETKAPAKYEKIKEPIIFSVESDGSIDDARFENIGDNVYEIVIENILIPPKPTEPPTTTKPPTATQPPITTQPPTTTQPTQPPSTTQPQSTTPATTNNVIPEPTTKPATVNTTTPTEPTIATTIPTPTANTESSAIIEAPINPFAEPPITPVPVIEPPAILDLPAEVIPEAIIVEHPVEAVFDVVEEYIVSDAMIPLGNGYFAVDLGDNLYEIFDENGVPLGYIRLANDEKIEEWTDFENLIPYADMTIHEAVNNPKTGKNNKFYYVILGFIVICGIVITIRKALFYKRMY